mgnify:CR=1 FL=1|tara:strand:+ start:1809 stop:2210 length:402 start_codon:yes stop_codon:yes gene_type:complete
MDKQAVKIKADVMWAFLENRNEMSNAYQVDLCNLSTKAIEALESLGVQVKNKEGKGSFITCKSQRPIHAYTLGGEKIENVKVGNGSKASAMIGHYDWTFKNKKGRSPSLVKLVVTELVEYSGNPLDIEEEDLL